MTKRMNQQTTGRDGLRPGDNEKVDWRVHPDRQEKYRSAQKWRAGMKNIWVVFMLLALLWIPDRTMAQPPELIRQLRVLILYDYNHDGIEEGVGEGRPVFALNGEEVIQFYATNLDSYVDFFLDEGNYRVVAIVSDDSPFYRWDCQEKIPLVEDIQNETVHCEWVWFVSFPFLSK